MVKLTAAAEKQALHESKSVAAAAASDEQACALKSLTEASRLLETVSIVDVLPDELLLKKL
jgi:hypothetical protein